MTDQQLKDFWARWAHRKNLTADMETVLTMAKEKVRKSAMRTIDATELTSMQVSDPLPFQHAGLVIVHELAQDDEGMMREGSLFRAAMDDYELQRSRELYPEARPIMGDQTSAT